MMECLAVSVARSYILSEDQKNSNFIFDFKNIFSRKLHYQLPIVAIKAWKAK